ncbi:MAG TPA: hypothetical protein VF628_03115 [Allosphingosinicella sp.]|jgi:hypothetical protein
MIDNFALGLTHGLLMLAAWRLLSRPDLDDASAPEPAATAEADRSLRGKRGTN